MPNFKAHCEISKERTKGNTYAELHKWMDEATEYLGHNHRLERHFYTQEYKDYIKKTWGSKAVVEWLFHIAIDNLETANKFASKYYGKIFDEITTCFDNEKITKCKFMKTYPNSCRVFEVDFKGEIKKKIIKPKEEKSYTLREVIESGYYEAEDLIEMGFDEDEVMEIFRENE